MVPGQPGDLVVAVGLPAGPVSIVRRAAATRRFLAERGRPSSPQDTAQDFDRAAGMHADDRRAGIIARCSVRPGCADGIGHKPRIRPREVLDPRWPSGSTTESLTWESWFEATRTWRCPWRIPPPASSTCHSRTRLLAADDGRLAFATGCFPAHRSATRPGPGPSIMLYGSDQSVAVPAGSAPSPAILSALRWPLQSFAPPRVAAGLGIGVRHSPRINRRRIPRDVLHPDLPCIRSCAWRLM